MSPVGEEEGVGVVPSVSELVSAWLVVSMLVVCWFWEIADDS